MTTAMAQHPILRDFLSTFSDKPVTIHTTDRATHRGILVLYGGDFVSLKDAPRAIVIAHIVSVTPGID